ncbi:hypothetical protein, partial [Fusobacterium sp.]|uniref:hypothetical protein n=1 Tax=Fusobacterium sp. TaxID=68766 RepID=UPI002608334B
MKEEKIKEILLKENYFILNKKIIKKLGVEMAYLLANFIEASDMISNDEGWFFQTYKIVEDLTGFKRKKQYNYIKELVRLGIILRKNMGIPRRRYFKINVEKIKEILYSDLEVKSLKEMIELEEEWLENSVFEEEDIEEEKPKKKFLKDKKVLLEDREEGEKENKEEILKGKEISKEEKEILEREENLKEEGSLKNDLLE